MPKFYYGGQAVIEGVMMRGRHQASVVVRKADGHLLTHTELLPGRLYAHRLARLPFVRGLVALWEMLILGTRMMLFSAGVHAGREEDANIPRGMLAGMIAVSLTFVVGLFFVLPLLLTRAGGHALHGSFISNVAEGIIRLALFIGYLALIGRLGQMHRVFQYHGAEHKTINAYEDGASLDPVTVQRYSLIHVRCGTAFLLWVVVLSIFVFALLGHPPLAITVLSRVVLVPLIAAAGYEVLRLGARYYHVGLVRFIMQPGLWLQRLTTREPELDQIEVAIQALAPVLEADGVQPVGLVATARGPRGLVTEAGWDRA